MSKPRKPEKLSRNARRIIRDEGRQQDNLQARAARRALGGNNGTQR